VSKDELQNKIFFFIKYRAHLHFAIVTSVAVAAFREWSIWGTSDEYNWNSFPFRAILVIKIRRVFWQNMLELTKAINGAKNCPARKNRKREDSDDFIKEIALLQTPRRSSKKRQNQPILNSIPLSREKDFLFSFTTNTTDPPFR